MGLPIQSTPTYKCVLPNSGKEVEYRPFLVKEQKILTIARESEDQKIIFDAIKRLIESVTDNKVSVDELAMIDLEYLFLKIRTVSVGESSTVKVECDDNKCNGTVTLSVNLEEIDVVGGNTENKIMITDTVGVMLKSPTVKSMSDIENAEDNVVEILKSCIESIFDEENVYEASETSSSDLNDFVESLTFGQLALVSDWFEDLPKLSKDVSGTCGVCNKEVSKRLEGLQSFF
jgi:hypothetical protein